MRLPRLAFGMRWWLALAFAAVAALTAVAVVGVLNRRSEDAFRKYAEAFAVGRSVVGAELLTRDAGRAELQRDALAFSRQRSVRLYVFDASGRLITPPVSRGVRWQQVPMRDEARRAALAGGRFIHGSADGADYVVGVPIRGGAGAAIVTYSRQRGMQTALGIIRNEFLQAALVALAVGAALGFVIALLTARRLGRIADAASAIGAGEFGRAAVTDRFPDEVGRLAQSIEQMRGRLQDLFAALQSDRDRLERIFARLDDGVLVVNRELEVEFANQRARDLLGLDDALGDGALRLAADLFRTGVPNHLRLTDGGGVLEVSGIPPSEGGDNVIIVVHDQTQKEQNERVQREFATNAAHELRTPLASIVTAVEMLQTGAKDDPAARDDFLEVIEREAARLTRLTRALLVLARADAHDETPRRGNVAVAPLLEQVAAALPAQQDVRVGVDCPPTLAIAGDPDLLEQAISSVAANAVQHTASGSVTLRGRAVNGSVVIEVADTGGGIAQDARPRIFDRFYRGDRHDGGFGLGLSIAREAVGALGGEIELDSEVAVGTTVRITLERGAVDA